MASPPPIDNGDGSGDDSTTDPDMMRKRDLSDLAGLTPPQQPRILPNYSYLFSNDKKDKRQEASTEEDDTTPPETIGPDQRTATEESCDTFTTSSTTTPTTSSTSSPTTTPTSTGASTGWQDQPNMTAKPHHPHHTSGPKQYGV